MAVDEGVVGEQPLRLDPVRRVEGEAAFDEAGHGCGALVVVDLAVREPGVVVDERVHPLVADPLTLLGAGNVPVAGDGVAGPAETDETLRVDVQQIAGAGPLVATRLLAWRLRGSRDPRPSLRVFLCIGGWLGVVGDAVSEVDA